MFHHVNGRGVDARRMLNDCWQLTRRQAERREKCRPR
jgi:hypothetical protein